MSDAIFQDLYKKLNVRQKEAVDAIDGPVMVIAGPGTGKTSILTLRIANILKNTDTSPDSILALTFTESGVHQMRKKLVDIIGSVGYRVHIHTFHSFCNEIIKHYSQEFPRIIGAQHMTDIDQIRIVEEILMKTPLENLKPYGNPFFYLKSILSEIRNLKREDVDPAAFAKIIARQEKKFSEIEGLKHEKGKYKGEIKGAYKSLQKKIENNKELQMIYAQYQEKLEEERLYDYEDMIMEVLRELRTNQDLLLQLQETYQYVLADEHQDANNAQNKLLELISGFHDSPNLFIVGDEKQAIFRFQGASLENFLYFKRRFPDAQLISLSENYRSTQQILDASFNLISHNNTLPDLRVELSAAKKGAFTKLKLHEFSTPAVEHEFVAQSIKDRIAAGADPSSIAVLYRDNRDAAPLTSALERHGIRVAIHSDSDLFSDPEIQKFLTLLLVVNDFGNDELLAKMLFIDFVGLDHLDVYKILRKTYEYRGSLFDTIRSRELLEQYGITNVDAVLNVYKTLSQLSVSAKNKSLIDTLEEIVATFKYTSHLLTLPDAVEKLELFDALFTQITVLVERHKAYKLEEYITFLNKLDEHGVATKKANRPKTGGKVHLMTAHKSKGLEFDTVFVTGLIEGHWGNRRSPTYFDIWMFETDTEDHSEEDERRLLYVAITRARHEVLLTYARQHETGKDTLPTQYLTEIDPAFIETISTQDFETQCAAVRKTYEKKERPKQAADQAYLRDIFLEQGLSVSALNNYLRCPWSFIFLNLLRIPKAQERHQLYGTAIHETLKVFFDAYREDKDLSKEKVLEIFTHFLNRKALTSADCEALLEKGTEALSGYYDTYMGTWPRAVINEFTVAGVFLPLVHAVGESIMLKGNLDKIETQPDGSVVVVDYKTGTPKSRGYIEGTIQSSDGDYGRQLVFYKMLLDRFENGKYSMRAGEIDFVEPDDRGNYKKERFEITAEQVRELESDIQRVAQEIMTFSFWDDECDDATCEYCELARYLKQQKTG